MQIAATTIKIIIVDMSAVVIIASFFIASHLIIPVSPGERKQEAGRASGRVLEGHPLLGSGPPSGGLILSGGASVGPSAFPRGPPEGALRGARTLPSTPSGAG
jgi:hypothetical protein